MAKGLLLLALVAAAHPAPELIHLRQTQFLGIVADEGVDPGQIEPRLDYGSR